MPAFAAEQCVSVGGVTIQWSMPPGFPKWLDTSALTKSFGSGQEEEEEHHSVHRPRQLQLVRGVHIQKHGVGGSVKCSLSI